jgi:hypothetical protein
MRLTVMMRLSGGTNAGLRDGALARLFAASGPIAEAPAISCFSYSPAPEAAK